MAKCLDLGADRRPLALPGGFPPSSFRSSVQSKAGRSPRLGLMHAAMESEAPFTFELRGLIKNDAAADTVQGYAKTYILCIKQD